MFESNGPEHARWVFHETQAMQDPDDAVLEIPLPTVKIEQHAELCWVEANGQRIHREVTTIQILLNRTPFDGRKSGRVFVIFGPGGRDIQFAASLQNDHGRSETVMRLQGTA